jgi:hypothetical protein
MKQNNKQKKKFLKLFFLTESKKEIANIKKINLKYVIEILIESELKLLNKLFNIKYIQKIIKKRNQLFLKISKSFL